MGQPLRIGIIGDHDPDRLSHAATEEALDHAAKALSLVLDRAWLPTPWLDCATGEVASRLDPFDGLWCAPGSPYASTGGAHAGIRYAREAGRPYIGT